MTKQQVTEALARLSELPTIPAVLVKIMEKSSDPEASALELGRYVAADQSLSAMLLRIVNSPYYGFHREIGSVTDAIVILGFIEVRNMVFAAKAVRTLGEGKTRIDRQALWRHALAAAVAADRCARLSKNAPHPSAYVGGLLHDIGKLALDVLYPERYYHATQMALIEGRPLAETELEQFGVDHADVGGHLCELWNLPPALADSVRFHHRPAVATVDAALPRLLAAADYLAYAADMGDPGNPIAPAAPDAALAFLDMTAPQLAHVRDAVAGAREKIGEMLGALRSQ